MEIVLMSHGVVGKKIFLWMLEHYRSDLSLVVTVMEDEIYEMAAKYNVKTIIYHSEDQLISQLSELNLELGVLAWWPNLVSGRLLRLTTRGFVNTHPSYLPYNRGKHYNFWNLVEEVPFGVSLHFVDEGIDSGDIIAQSQIQKTWEDDGKSLYDKAQAEIVKLFVQAYPKIRVWEIHREPQDLSKGSLHFSRELESASRIDLDAETTPRRLLNLLRAKTFPGHPACRFSENGEIFEVTVSIRKITS